MQSIVKASIHVSIPKSVFFYLTYFCSQYSIAPDRDDDFPLLLMFFSTMVQELKHKQQKTLFSALQRLKEGNIQEYLQLHEHTNLAYQHALELDRLVCFLITS